VDVQGDRGVTLHEAAQPWQQPAGSERRHRADGENAVGFGTPDELRRLGEIAQSGAHPFSKVSARRGQRYAPPIAQEQRRAERSLERANLMAHRAVRDEDLLGGSRKTLQARRRLEGPQRAEGRDLSAHPACESCSHARRKDIVSFLASSLLRFSHWMN